MDSYISLKTWRTLKNIIQCQLRGSHKRNLFLVFELLLLVISDEIFRFEPCKVKGINKLSQPIAWVDPFLVDSQTFNFLAEVGKMQEM